jgi:hypothetical protein
MPEGTSGGRMGRGQLVVASEPRVIVRDRPTARKPVLHIALGQSESPNCAGEQSNSNEPENWWE